MPALRTPNHFFENLEGYPFEPNYLHLKDSDWRMHYVDEGPKDGPVVLLLHGEPSWSYLYRKMIPVLVENGFRTIAPDLIGFGKSDKPDAPEDYTYQSHLEWLSDFIHQLDLQGILLYCQDWGGLLGLRIVTTEPERFSRIVVANTFLPTGMQAAPPELLQWINFTKTAPQFIISKTINRATNSELSLEVLRAYDAPFPDDRYKAGARKFPQLVPISPDDPESENNLAAWQFFAQWEKPMLTLFSDSDPITKGGELAFQKIVPGTQGQAHSIIEDAGHFLQEDKGAEIAALIVDWVKK